MARAVGIRFDILSAGSEYREADMCEYIVWGLPEEYEGLKMYVGCHRELLEDVENLESLIQHRESQIHRDVELHGRNAVNAVTAPTAPSAPFAPSAPSGSGDKPNGSGGRPGGAGKKFGKNRKGGVYKKGKNKKYVCFYCGRPGHTVKYCWDKRSGKPGKGKWQGTGNKSSAAGAHNNANNSMPNRAA